MRPCRRGLFGGTFDPPHLGHLAVARGCQRALALDEVVWLPCRRPALKHAAAATGAQRLAMVELLIADQPGLRADDRELHRTGVTYTVDTVRAFAAEQPGAQLWWLMGLDALVDFERWREPQAILELCRLAVVDRPGYARAAVAAQLPAWVAAAVDWVQMPPIEAASRVIRADAADGELLGTDLSDEVASYIAKHRLYLDA